MSGFIDLHCHLLPALDDGAPALRESMELATILEQLGFSTIYATPHQKAGAFMPSRSAIDEAHQSVARAIASAKLGLTLHLGAENFWDDVFVSRWAQPPKPSEIPCYTGGKAFLVEVHPRMVPPRLEDQLFQLRMTGILPVLAHPERYQPLWPSGKSLDRYAAIGRSTALVVDLGAIDGAHGNTECKMARRLVEEGLAHAVASDSHTVSDTRSAAAGMAWIKKRCGTGRLQALLAEHPARILAGDLPD